MQRNIELRAIQNHYDLEDLTQECTAYMKTKQFMTSRIYQQQEEIELLRRGILFHCTKHCELFPMLHALSEEVSALNDKLKSSSGSLNISGDEFASSMEYEDNQVSEGVSRKEKDKEPEKENEAIIKKDLIKENLQLRMEKEKLTQQIIDQSLELNRARSDKFLLFNELNELTTSLKKCNLDELKSCSQKELSRSSLTREDMPVSNGIHFNILSSQSQIAKLLRLDVMKTDLNKNVNVKETQKEKKKESPAKMSLDVYLKLLKSTEDEFNEILSKKLSKKRNDFQGNK